MLLRPAYQHDCDVCQFLGSYKHDEKWYDLYYCERCDDGTVLARYGDDGPDYLSLMLHVLLYVGLKSDDPLVEAARRQIRRWQVGDYQ
jgi:hypothetical protein